MDKLLKISVWGFIGIFCAVIEDNVDATCCQKLATGLHSQTICMKSLVYSEDIVYIKSYPGSSYGKACKVLNKFCAQIDNE